MFTDPKLISQIMYISTTLTERSVMIYLLAACKAFENGKMLTAGLINSSQTTVHVSTKRKKSEALIKILDTAALQTKL